MTPNVLPNPTTLTLISILKSNYPQTSKPIHALAVRLDLLHPPLSNALLHAYSRSHSAATLFRSLPSKDIFTWTTLISSHAPLPALTLFSQLTHYHPSIPPNCFTLSAALSACRKLGSLRPAKAVHTFSLKGGTGNVVVRTALVEVYAKCGRMGDAWKVFDGMSVRDGILWNVMLVGCFGNGEFEEGIELFREMEVGREGLVSVATWNSVISGCVRCCRPMVALELFREMVVKGFRPNYVSVVSVLPACANLECLNGGKEIHGYCLRSGMLRSDERKGVDGEVVVATALVLLYAKCGDLDVAKRVFDLVSRKDVILWNTIILANSMHGCGREALLFYRNMLTLGYKPNSATFMAVLSGCSHSQLVDEGRDVFDSMSKDHGIKLDAEHYSCMVDVLCRAGHLQEAYEFIQTMPMEPLPSAWGALLGGCRVYKNIELGEIAAHKLFEIEPSNPGNYILLSNIYVTAKLWEEASKIRKMMRDKGVEKELGCSWIPIGNQVYTFVKGDTRNNNSEKIYGFLTEVNKKMKLDGHLPKTDYVLQDINEKEKEEVLCGHSEKLAVAFGILNLNGKSSVRVFKNLRICGDCHDTIKYIAKSAKVKIIVRDSMRFHHFRDGICSCGDIW